MARPGASISDKVKVQGVGTTAVKIEVTLYGPFAIRAAIGCKGTPAGTTSFTAKGDGTHTSPGIRIDKAGFYVFREHLVGSGVVKDVLGSCTAESEVSLAAPQIITGRGDVNREVRAHARNARLAPRRVTIGSVGIDATSSGVGIDTAKGVLGVLSNIHHTGWWVDGAQPGDKTGAVLIAGHVDRASVGPGAFFHLKDAKPRRQGRGQDLGRPHVHLQGRLGQELPEAEAADGRLVTAGQGAARAGDLRRAVRPEGPPLPRQHRPDRRSGLSRLDAGGRAARSRRTG